MNTNEDEATTNSGTNEEQSQSDVSDGGRTALDGGEEIDADSEIDTPPVITLDRYLSRRRPSVRLGWAQMTSMIAMVVALLMILMFKDQCGYATSGLFHTVAPAPNQSRDEIPVQYRTNQTTRKKSVSNKE